MAPKEEPEEDRSQEKKVCRELKVEHVNFAYPDGKKILDDISFTAKKGEIIGITGSVACGKSTLGKVFLCEYPYEGSISCDEKELRANEGYGAHRNHRLFLATIRSFSTTA